MALTDRLLEHPSTTEFLNHPDFRQISTFFLGATFFYASIGIVHSRFVGVVKHALARLFAPRPPPSREAHLESARNEKVRSWKETLPLAGVRDDPLHLCFILTLFVAIATLALFGSLLQYASSSSVGCAFITAWVGMGTQCVRLCGLFQLSLELRKLRARPWEIYLLWSLLFGSLVLMFVANTLSSGTLKEVNRFSGLFLCYQEHFLLTSVLASTVNILLEIYVTTRIFVLTVPSFFRIQHQVTSLFDNRLMRGSSLLLLDILTLIPSAINVSVIADTIPFSIGAMFVLASFNRVASSGGSDAQTYPIPPSAVMTFGSIDRWQSSQGSPIHFASAPSVSHTIKSNTTHQEYIQTSAARHPFALNYADDSISRRLARRSLGPVPASPQSAATTESAIARSVEGAVVSFAFQQRSGSQDRRSYIATPTKTLSTEGPSQFHGLKSKFSTPSDLSATSERRPTPSPSSRSVGPTSGQPIIRDSIISPIESDIVYAPWRRRDVSRRDSRKWSAISPSSSDSGLRPSYLNLEDSASGESSRVQTPAGPLSDLAHNPFALQRPDQMSRRETFGKRPLYYSAGAASELPGPFQRPDINTPVTSRSIQASVLDIPYLASEEFVSPGTTNGATNGVTNGTTVPYPAAAHFSGNRI